MRLSLCPLPTHLHQGPGTPAGLASGHEPCAVTWSCPARSAPSVYCSVVTPVISLISEQRPHGFTRPHSSPTTQQSWRSRKTPAPDPGDTNAVFLARVEGREVTVTVHGCRSHMLGTGFAPGRSPTTSHDPPTASGGTPPRPLPHKDPCWPRGQVPCQVFQRP